MVYHRKLKARTIHKKIQRDGLYWLISSSTAERVKCGNKTTIAQWSTDVHTETSVAGNAAIYRIPNVYTAPPN